MTGFKHILIAGLACCLWTQAAYAQQNPFAPDGYNPDGVFGPPAMTPPPPGPSGQPGYGGPRYGGPGYGGPGSGGPGYDSPGYGQGGYQQPGNPLPGEMGYVAPPPVMVAPPPTMRDFSWIYIDHPEPKAFRINDIVSVIVSERSEVTLNSRFNRQRNASLKSELKEFVKLDGLTLVNDAETSPTIDMNQQERIQSTGQVTDQEGITYRIAATVVDIRPNGNLVLEARKKINANDDLWEYTLHGEVRYEDVLVNNTVLSENIANLNIEKRMHGRVHSSTGRRWGNKLIDTFWPF